MDAGRRIVEGGNSNVKRKTRGERKPAGREHRHGGRTVAIRMNVVVKFLLDRYIQQIYTQTHTFHNTHIFVPMSLYSC